MRPEVIEYTRMEGGHWYPASQLGMDTIHAFRFSDGSEWDTINGWRQDTLPKEDTLWYYQPMQKFIRRSIVVPQLAAELRLPIQELDKKLFQASVPVLPGPPTTSAPSAPPSASASTESAGLSGPVEEQLWEALKTLMKFSASYDLKATAASAQWNFSFEAKPPTDATGSGSSPPKDGRWDAALQGWIARKDRL